jgi:multiple sugar transport system ATP-binding protein
MARVLIDKLAKVYGEKNGPGVRAVNDVSLIVDDGEFMVLVGPSGCGKSTTLRLIAGLEEISGGTITIDGKVVNNVPPKDRDLAMVFQNYALYPHMTVFENLAFGLRQRKLPAPEIAARVREAAAMLGLEPYLQRRPAALSGGQRQRVAVGRAIVRQPKVFLFDEPLSNLDAKMRAATRAELSRLHDRLDATMIYVTHDQMEAMTMGDRICVMHDGNIMQVAPPLELYDRPANLFVAGFIGSPPMNLLPGTLATGSGGLVFTEDNPASTPLRVQLDDALARAAGASAGRPVVLGIRPEDIRAEGAGAVLSARIEVVEPMGAETFVHLASGGHTLIARLPPSAQPTRGDTLSFSFAPGKVHLFDAASGAALR